MRGHAPLIRPKAEGEQAVVGLGRAEGQMADADPRIKGFTVSGAQLGRQRIAGTTRLSLGRMVDKNSGIHPLQSAVLPSAW